MNRHLFLLLLLIYSSALCGQGKEGKTLIKDSVWVDLRTVAIDGSSSANLRAVEGVNVFAGKKTELIVPDALVMNKAVNNARQLFGRIPGIHIWESDRAGLQLGIGGRGLSPNRSAHFNIRQNGYDISADALGYPESYYTPPVEVIQRIELVRGAASLQYGPQFGGLVNFVLRRGAEDTPLELTLRQTGGSWGFYNGLLSVGGSTGHWNYYAYYQYKRGASKRTNSTFQSHNAFGRLAWTSASGNVRIAAEYTHLDYLAQQPGGLTDAQFADNPWQSFRARNWFKVQWRLPAITLDWNISKRWKYQMRNFCLIAGRDALGILTRINEIDRGQERDLWQDDFLNVGHESRFLGQYQLRGLVQTVLIGARFYRGSTRRMQGFANNLNGPDFSFLNPQNPGHSTYSFPGYQAAVFGEHVFQLPGRISVTPGARVEFLSTEAKGQYNLTIRDFAGNLIKDTLIPEYRSRIRPVWLVGLGFTYRPFAFLEIYWNASRNYRSITFSDLRIVNPNLRVDAEIQDESGWNADIGFRGNWKNILTYDVSGFMMWYDNRIGQLLVADSLAPYIPYRLRTNVGTSLTGGIEWYSELDVLRAVGISSAKWDLRLFSNLTYTHARYIRSREKGIAGKEVELVSPWLLRTGLQTNLYGLKLSVQYAYVHRHYTDATNADRTASAVNGIVPSYGVVDLSMQYSYRWFQFEAGIQNLTNARYFTRRADGYPGPGIIPAEPIQFYGGLQIQLQPLSFRKKRS